MNVGGLPRRNAPFIGVCAIALSTGFANRGAIAGESSGWDTPWQTGPEVRDVVKFGLPSVTQDIAQTQDGYLWFASMNGLYRYDGIRSASIPVSDGGTTTHLLLAGKNGELWVATGGGYLDVSGTVPHRPFSVGLREGAGGLFRLRGGETTQVLAPDARAEHWVWALAELRDGRLAVGTEDGLWLISPGGENAIRLRWPSLDRKLSHISSLILQQESGRETLWIATAAGVWQWPVGVSAEPELRFPIAGVRCLRPADTGFWIIQDTQLFKVERGAIVSTLRGEPGEQMREFLSSTPADDAWVGTTFGLRRLRKDTLSWASEEIPRQSVRRLLRDREGSVWVALKGLGIAQLRVPVVKNLGRHEGMPSDAVASVLGDVRGPAHTLWAMTGDGLVNVSQGTINRTPIGRASLDFRFRNIAQQQDGSLWLAYDNLIDFRNGVATVHEGVSDVVSVHVDSSNHLWLGKEDGTVLRYDRGITTTAPLVFARKDGLCGDRVRAMFDGKDRTLWFVSANGVTRFDRATYAGICFPLPPGNAGETRGHSAATQIGPINETTAWITATGDQGLFRLKGGELRPVPSIPGFLPTSLYAILIEKTGYAWFSSNHGVFRVAIGELDRFVDGTGPAPAFVHIDHNSGMRSSDCQATFNPVMIPWHDGGVMVATALGVAAIKPPESWPSPQVQLFIESILVDGQPVPQSRVIAPGGRRIEIHYNAPTFLTNAALRFEQRLDGLDTAWRDSGEQREAIYSSLAPGRYIFRVRVRTGDASDTREASIAFRVLAPWYRRTTTLVGAILLVALAVFVVYRLRLAQLSARFSAITDERTRIARDWHDGLSQIFLGIGYQLQAIRMRFSEKDDPAIDPSIITLVDETRSMVKNAQEEVKAVLWDLRAGGDGNRFLESFRELATDTHRKFGVSVQIRCTGELPREGELTEQWRQIAKEAVTNAIKHGQAKNIQITLTFTSQGATLTIDDDGKGLDSPIAAPGDRSFGVVGMRERARRCGGQLTLEPGVDGGTRVTVVVNYPAHG